MKERCEITRSPQKNIGSFPDDSEGKLGAIKLSVVEGERRKRSCISNCLQMCKPPSLRPNHQPLHPPLLKCCLYWNKTQGLEGAQTKPGGEEERLFQSNLAPPPRPSPLRRETNLCACLSSGDKHPLPGVWGSLAPMSCE